MKAYHVTEESNFKNIKNHGFFKTQGVFGEGVYFFDDCSKAEQRGKDVNNQHKQSNLVVIEVELTENNYVFINSLEEYEEFCKKYDCSPGNGVSWKSEDLFNGGIKGIVFNFEHLDEIVVYDLNTIKA